MKQPYPIKGDIYPLDDPLTTENNQAENRGTESQESSPKTLEKLKPCFELLSSRT